MSNQTINFPIPASAARRSSEIQLYDILTWLTSTLILLRPLSQQPSLTPASSSFISPLITRALKVFPFPSFSYYSSYLSHVFIATASIPDDFISYGNDFANTGMAEA